MAMAIRQEFSCTLCQHTDVFAYPDASPVCCGRPMRGGDIKFPRGDETQTRLHLITLKQTPIVDWQLPQTPKHVFELWQLAPGRAKGERIGWIGTRETVVEWKMPAGVKLSGGFANTIEEAAGLMLEALQGGVASKRIIEAQLVN